jgi:hypothetical protein
VAGGVESGSPFGSPVAAKRRAMRNKSCGAILYADIYQPAFNGAVTYDVYAASATTNQTGGDVHVYSPGHRNPYDLVLHSNGEIYATDNGPNSNFGEGSAQGCAQNQNGANPQAADELNLINPSGRLVETNPVVGSPVPGQPFATP